MKIERALIYRKRAEFFRALSHPVRLLIVEGLVEGEKCVNGIEKMLGFNQSSISQHLNILRTCGIVDYRTDGRRRCYFLIDRECVKDMLNCTNNKDRRKNEDRG
ncbi:MAG: metalloregulator ArsR/SmtB family transcription factor [Elusimicrobiota bacterium]